VSVSDFSHWVEIAKNTCEILAIFGGAAWTYLNYFRGRVYKPRLECSVEASPEKHSGHAFLRVVVRIRNIGLSRVSIQQEGTGILLVFREYAGSKPLVPEPGSMGRVGSSVRCILGQGWGGIVGVHRGGIDGGPASRRCPRIQSNLDRRLR
jgi:hypothetical protein